MRELKAFLLDGDKKEKIIFKIENESFSINSDDILIKIPYSDIDSYNYNEKESILIINRVKGIPVKLNITKDQELLKLLDDIITKGKDKTTNNNVEHKKEESEKNSNVNQNAGPLPNDKTTNGYSGWGILFGCIVFVILIFCGAYIYTNFIEEPDMPTGCYRAVNSNGGLSDFKLCIHKDSVSYDYIEVDRFLNTYEKSEKLYPEWLSFSETLQIVDNYDNEWFNCTFDKESNDSMQCRGMGYGGIGVGDKTTWEKE